MVQPTISGPEPESSQTAALNLDAIDELVDDLQIARVATQPALRTALFDREDRPALVRGVDDRIADSRRVKLRWPGKLPNDVALGNAWHAGVRLLRHVRVTPSLRYCNRLGTESPLESYRLREVDDCSEVVCDIELNGHQLVPCERTSNGSYSASLRSHQSTVRCERLGVLLPMNALAVEPIRRLRIRAQLVELGEREIANRLNLLDIAHD